MVIEIDVVNNSFYNDVKRIYNSNGAIIISSNKVLKARNHMVLLNKSVKIHKQ